MIQFEITGGVDPLLKAHLEVGDVLFAENNAMVTMDQALNLTSNAKGGFFKSLWRKTLNEENFFQQRFESKEKAGDVLLAPTIPGDVKLLEIGTKQYFLSDGAYLASTADISLEVKTQSIGKALFSKSGGFFLMKTEGTGVLAVSGFGSIREIEVTPDNPVLVDNGHLVAWDSALEYDMTLNTAHTGLFGKLVESATTGEGIVLKFKGQGKVLVCSRNRGGFLSWIFGSLAPQLQTKN